jgi:adenine-specific DNA methylase
MHQWQYVETRIVRCKLCGLFRQPITCSPSLAKRNPNKGYMYSRLAYESVGGKIIFSGSMVVCQPCHKTFRPVVDGDYEDETQDDY